jgi:hypothetical protein
MTSEEIKHAIDKYTESIIGKPYSLYKEDSDTKIIGFGLKYISKDNFELYVVCQDTNDKSIFDTTLDAWLEHNGG